MKLRHHRLVAECLALYAMAAMITNVAGAPAPSVEPRLLTLRPQGIYVGTELEADRETRTIGDPSFSTTVDRLYAAPLVGAGARGSVYHPNLVHYDFQGEFGYAWQDLSSESDAGPGIDRSEAGWLVRYNANALFLSKKPYATTFTATRARTFRELDFFNRVRVDSETFGGSTGYSEGPVPFRITVNHLEEDQSDALVDTSLVQDTLEFRAQNKRKDKNVTDLVYTYGNYSRETGEFFRDEGAYHSATLNDVEHFGHNDRVVLNSFLYFNQVDSTVLDARDVRLNENLTIDHSSTIQTIYDGSLNYYSSGPVDTFGSFARAALRHQLYESLTSLADVHGDRLEVNGPGASQEIWRYGVGLSETYSKRLSTWGHLRIGNNVRLDQERRDTDNGLVTVINEQHTLDDSRAEFLNQPTVLSVSAVTDTNGIPYVEGIDYQLIRHGMLTEIRRIFTSPRLPNRTAVLVNYTAQPQPSGSFETFADQFQIRIDFFKGLFGIYSRLAWIENTVHDRFVLEDSFISQSGVDFSWRWTRAGAEYETRESNLISYDAINVFESFFFEPTDSSTLNLDFRQRWARYEQTDSDLTDYSFIARWHWRLSAYLFYTAEGGVRFEESRVVDQRVATARTEMNFSMGKLRVLLGYQFNNDDVRGELREKHFVYLRVKRYF